ncbi:hypothetical protein [Ensifer soli]|uniref:hypothetical protein n=1 Tax=Ciceribacter sp. sgz301302 TaxID=3342379 RepID=UPI0035B9F5E7
MGTPFWYDRIDRARWSMSGDRWFTGDTLSPCFNASSGRQVPIASVSDDAAKTKGRSTSGEPASEERAPEHFQPKRDRFGAGECAKNND